MLEACIAESRGERVFCDVQPTRLWERKARRTLCLFAGIGGGTIEDELCCVGRFNALRASSILMSITDNYRRFLKGVLSENHGASRVLGRATFPAVERKAHQYIMPIRWHWGGVGRKSSTAALAETRDAG